MVALPGHNLYFFFTLFAKLLLRFEKLTVNTKENTFLGQPSPNVHRLHIPIKSLMRLASGKINVYTFTV